MERAISEMEKIRRAEEIYSRRKNSKADEGLHENKNIYKFLFQVTLMINIIIVILAVQNKDYIFTKNFINQVDSYNINVKAKIENWIKTRENRAVESKNNEEKNNSNTKKVEEIVGESTQVQSALIESNQPQNKLVENNQIQGALVENNEKELTQMEKDAYFIKENYSIILPMAGIKTSGFGDRESQNSKINGFHKGVDISAKQGTIIKSAISGKVTQVSSAGDYGKHVRVTAGDLTVLYAHCLKIYVNEGDDIMQGQEIAEVGSTGNSTGPHLHFEISYEDRLVDPELILKIQ